MGTPTRSMLSDRMGEGGSDVCDWCDAKHLPRLWYEEIEPGDPDHIDPETGKEVIWICDACHDELLDSGRLPASEPTTTEDESA